MLNIIGRTPLPNISNAKLTFHYKLNFKNHFLASLLSFSFLVVSNSCYAASFPAGLRYDDVGCPSDFTARPISAGLSLKGIVMTGLAVFNCAAHAHETDSRNMDLISREALPQGSSGSLSIASYVPSYATNALISKTEGAATIDHRRRLIIDRKERDEVTTGMRSTLRGGKVLSAKEMSHSTIGGDDHDISSNRFASTRINLEEYLNNLLSDAHVHSIQGQSPKPKPDIDVSESKADDSGEHDFIKFDASIEKDAEHQINGYLDDLYEHPLGKRLQDELKELLIKIRQSEHLKEQYPEEAGILFFKKDNKLAMNTKLDREYRKINGIKKEVKTPISLTLTLMPDEIANTKIHCIGGTSISSEDNNIYYQIGICDESPIIALAHELLHGLHILKDFEAYSLRKNDPDDFDNPANLPWTENGKLLGARDRTFWDDTEEMATIFGCPKYPHNQALANSILCKGVDEDLSEFEFLKLENHLPRYGHKAAADTGEFYEEKSVIEAYLAQLYGAEWQVNFAAMGGNSNFKFNHENAVRSALTPDALKKGLEKKASKK